MVLHMQNPYKHEILNIRLRLALFKFNLITYSYQLDKAYQSDKTVERP